MSQTLPLFPLGTVLYPGLLLPLHIFEERYRQLVRDLLNGPEPRRFGVIAIRRGRETGMDGISSLHEICVEIAEKIDESRYDVIASCSGDGLPHEVFNGLARKPNASEALRKVAVVQLPCGTGNAMSWNLNGTGSCSMAALCIVKGLRTPLDLASITQGEKRTISFLSQSVGIVAESDLGTDNVRWMGSARFTYGFFVRLLGKTVYPCEIAIKTEIADKAGCKAHYKAEIAKGRHLVDSASEAVSTMIRNLQSYADAVYQS